MYFNKFFAKDYYADTYWGVDEEVPPVPQEDVGGNFAGFVQGLREEDELLVIIQAFLHMRNL